MLYRSRLNHVIENMKHAGMHQLIVADDENFLYLTGSRPFALERVAVLLVKDTGEIRAFVNNVISLESDGSYEICWHTDVDDPYMDLAAALDPGTIGIDGVWQSKHLIRLMEKRPDIRPVDGTIPLIRARLIKDEEEIRRLRESSALNDRVIAHAIQMASDRPELSEQELSEEVSRFFSANGAGKSPYFQIVSYGANAADPHHEPDRVTVRKDGDCILFDLYAPLNDYWCDMTRTVFYKSVSEEHRMVYEAVRAAQQKAIDTVRPGIRISEVHRKCIEVLLQEGGYRFHGRIGHGVGIGIHEFPDVSPVNDIVLEPGMVFTLEPGIYLRDDIGVRIEDVVLVTADGCEPLNHYPKTLQIIGI